MYELKMGCIAHFVEPNTGEPRRLGAPCQGFNAKALKSSLRRNSGVGVVGCERKIAAVRERKFEVDAENLRIEWASIVGPLAPKRDALGHATSIVMTAYSKPFILWGSPPEGR